jgi:hypothetical protein
MIVPDYSRQFEHIDHAVTGSAVIGVIGAGGAGKLVEHLARCGIGEIWICDPDVVSATNLATQGYYLDQVGKPKVAALEENIRRVDPRVTIRAFAIRYQDLQPHDREDMWRRVSLMLAMTDHFETQMAINTDALTFGVDTIFAMMGDGLRQMEVTATFPDVVAEGGGCHACHIWPRVKAYRNGFKNKEVIPSHIVSADALNAQLEYIALSRLHLKASSSKPIAEIARRFSKSPCLLTQLDPTFWPENPASYGVLPPELGLFTTHLFSIDTPKEWTCEACGTVGTK